MTGRSLVGGGTRSDFTGRSGASDMDRWLDKVFDPVLDSGVDALGDSRSVERRLRGGGAGEVSDSDMVRRHAGHTTHSYTQTDTTSFSVTQTHSGRGQGTK